MKATTSSLELGARIAGLRHKASLTQSELAALCGLTQSEISKLERGARRPGFHTVQALAKGLSSRVKRSAATILIELAQE